MEDMQKQMSDVKNYNFEKNKKFSGKNVRFLQYLSDEYCKVSNLQLQHELKHQDLKFKVNTTDQLSLSTFMENSDYDTFLMDFSIGRAHNLILRIDRMCVLTIVECLLGGDGTVHNINRPITKIDMAILKYLNEMLFKKITLDIDENAIVSLNEAHTNKAQFRTSLSSSETLFVAVIDVLLKEGKVGEFNICIPLSSVEDFLEEIASNNREESDKDKQEELEHESIVIQSLNDNKVPFEVVAELGKTTITVGELLELNVDDVLMLHKKIDEPVDVLVGGSLAYTAIPATLNNKKAIVINDLANEIIEEESKNDGKEDN
jgi:flagellar motor switch protein FliM